MAKSARSPLLWIVVAVLLLVGGAAVVAVLSVLSGPGVERGSWLVVDLRGGMLEYDPPSDLASELLGGTPLTLQRTLDNLAKAAADDRIEGVVLKLGLTTSVGGASRQELRRAIAGVRAADKRVVAWAEALTPPGVHVAAACDTVALVPTGTVIFIGSTAASMHVRALLDKLHVNPNIHKIKDYKSAAEMVTRTDMSPEARENRSWLLDEIWNMTNADLAADRGLDEARVVSLMQHAVFTAAEAREGGLVDELWYWDELEAALKRDGDEALRTVSPSTYAKVSAKDVGLGGARTVAVVHAQGTIAGAKSGVNPLLGLTMGHETVVADLRRAEKDAKVAAVVFRVDSPGGDGLASDLISRQVDVMKRTKPVVVSMADVAASGGYMVAYRANKVVADPLTITGSIGSISGKFNMRGLYDLLGISYDTVTKGPMAEFYSELRDFTDEERARFEEHHWAGFNQWLADVAQRRGMPFAEAEKLAHGRVWSGRQAMENGLVDELGGLDRAVAVAKELAGIPESEQVTLVHYPAKKSLFAMLREKDGSLAGATVRWLVLRAVHDDLAQAVALLGGNAALMEPLELR